jgi:hypothetical protein
VDEEDEKIFFYLINYFFVTLPCSSLQVVTNLWQIVARGVYHSQQMKSYQLIASWFILVECIDVMSKFAITYWVWLDLCNL